jgi:putative colanic acid biosynthesis acetyltransferase WcaF
MSFDLIDKKPGFVGPTFNLRNRLLRTLWNLTWFLLARWTPPQLHKWRILLLNIFGARVSGKAYVYGSADIWAPWNLQILPLGTLGPRVQCYNIAPISIGRKAIVSQGAYLCTGTHDHRDPAFPLIARPISISDGAWVCANAFVGPGVTIGVGAILGATGVTFEDLESWTIYIGNPAVPKRRRSEAVDEADDR